MQPGSNQQQGHGNFDFTIILVLMGVFVLLLFAVFSLAGLRASRDIEALVPDQNASQPGEPPDNNARVVAVAEDSVPFKLSFGADLDCAEPYDLAFPGEQPPAPNIELEDHFLFFERDDLFFDQLIDIGTSDGVGFFVDGSGLLSQVHFATLNVNWETRTFLTCDPSDFEAARVTPISTTTPPPLQPVDSNDVTTAAPTTSTTTTTTIPNGRPVPDVIGLDLNDAILEMFDWELQIVRENETSDEIEAGFVIRTNPPAGTQVAPGSSITLVVSTGPE